MFTVCPKCALTLVVTAADLRVAQGYVRCGRCSNVFNAIVGLSEDRQAHAGVHRSAAPSPPRPPPPPPPPEPEPEPPVESEIEVEIDPGSESAAAQQPASQVPDEEEEEEERYSDDHGIEDEALEFDPSATDVTEVFIEPTHVKGEPTGTFESIILRAEEGTLPEEEEEPARTEQPEVEDDELNAELRQLAERLATTGEIKAPAVKVETPPADLRAANDESIVPHQPAAAPDVVEPEKEDETDAPPESGRVARWAWAGGTFVLVLVLLAQVAHHYRNDLAVHPRLYGPLTSFYASLGMPLSPRWDLSGYEVRQLGAESEPGETGRLTVRASLKNASEQPQPMPLLRVTVQDRFGNRIAASDVAPSVYLPRAIPASSLLAVGQRIDAEMAFVDPGTQAVGFEIDACLPVENGGIACANDAVSR